MLPAPVGAKVAQPTQGMEPTNQNAAPIAIAVGNAMVVNTAITNFGTRGFRFAEAELRSQDMAFALLPMPASVVRTTKAGISPLKASVRSVHRSG